MTKPDQPAHFASKADFDAWQLDLTAFGTAALNEQGKHVPVHALSDYGRSPAADGIAELRNANAKRADELRESSGLTIPHVRLTPAECVKLWAPPGLTSSLRRAR